MKKMWFSVILESQTGPKMGEPAFQTDETNLSGYLTIAGQKSYLQGKVLRKNHYVASLRLRTGNGEEECDAGAGFLPICRENALAIRKNAM